MLIESFTCVICGSTFERDRSKGGRPPQLCGEECYKARAIAKTRAWNKANPERKAAQNKASWARYYARHREAMNAKSRQYARDNPEWKRAQDSAYRAIRLGSPDAERFTLDEIFTRDSARCHLCGKKVPRAEATMDHIVPASLGGPHTRANVALAHRSCNASKGNRIAEEQLRLLG